MQRSFYLRIFTFILTLSAIYSCDKAKENYYERPEWLEPPIYQQLEERGNFTNYLKLVDKANYTQTLNAAGYYTVFAPNDDAFSEYFSQNGYSSVDDIDSILAKKIVTYSMCITPASYETIDDFQDGTTTATLESTLDKAFKRTTYNYKWVYKEADENGIERYVIDFNSSPGVAGDATQIFNSNDFNQKNIPFFTSAYMAQEGISATDYNYFYPNAELTDFNVANAKVIEKDIWAENGIIHVVDKVIPPLNNLEEILEETDQCSEFKSILDKYIVEYKYAFDNFQLKYEQSSGQRQDIYMKVYRGAAFNLNCENYLTFSQTSRQMDSQIDGYTLFAPNNTAMQDFYNDKLFNYGYNSLDEMPDYIIREFVNAHMFMNTVWPTLFDATTNLYGEEARFDVNSNVKKIEMGSNGVFYAVDKVQATNAFSTVLADILLNPDYSLMYQALLDVEPMAENLKSTKARYLLFPISNDQFEQAGLAFNSTSNSWEFTDDVYRPDLGSSAFTALQRLLYLHIILLSNDEEIELLTSSGVIKAYNEEYIAYNRGRIYGSGNSRATQPRITETIESGAINGQSYALSNAILFSNGNIGEVLSVTSISSDYKATQLMAYLRKIADATYVNDDGIDTYLSGCVYNNENQEIKDISNTSFLTVFLPNDEAIAKAVEDGVLPAIENFANGTLGPEVLAQDNQTMENFIKYHIIKNN
ncbi:MAG: fasciclin domain-containing protein, partial [Prolixibacteraceae bacterium]|nr:fasciclin domain-containing protein [Prolixibacteraceae bacterium]